MTLPLVDLDPVVAPRIDRAAVEAARLIRAARTRLVEEEPSVDFEALAEGRRRLDETRGDNEPRVRSWLQRQRSRGRLVTVTVDGTLYVPLYQLDEAFDLDERAALVNARLDEAGLDEWAVWDWWTIPSPWVEARPIDLLETARQHDPDAGDRLEAAVAGLLAEPG